MFRQPITLAAMVTLAAAAPSLSTTRHRSLHPVPVAQQRKPDLADLVAGTYQGDVTADAKGSSHNGVTVTVTRVGRNLVEVTSDYARLPTVRIRIEMAGGAVVNTSGQNTFLIERDRDPSRLDLSIDGAALIVHKA